MSMIEVKATKDGKEEIIAYDFGDNLEDAVNKFGADVVFSGFRSDAKIDLQARMRARMAKGQPVEDLVSIWKPGIKLERAPVDAFTAAKNAFSKMTAEERAAFLQSIEG